MTPNTVVGARRAAGLSVSHAAADPLGFSPRHNRSRGFTGSVSEHEKKQKNARRAERNNLVEIETLKHVPQPATRGRAEHSSQLSLGEIASLSQCYTDRPASPTNNLDFPTKLATFLHQHSV